MTNNEKYQRRFNFLLTHQGLCGAILLLAWFAINVLVLASTRIMEFRRDGLRIPAWEPFIWEISSCVVLLLLIPLGLWLNDHWFSRLRFKAWLVAHLLATLPFSLLHVGGMVGLRHLSYSLMGTHYEFGNLPTELFYEYRKDAQAYITLALVIAGYRFILRRLQGEASYLADSDESESSEHAAPPERLLIKKLGREFLIQTREIEWIEAAGNYANLHSKNSVYPMRITMDKLEKMLPGNFTRIHRSSIVNLEYIQEMQALDTGDYQVTLRNQVKLTLSRRYREDFKALLSLGE